MQSVFLAPGRSTVFICHSDFMDLVLCRDETNLLDVGVILDLLKVLYSQITVTDSHTHDLATGDSVRTPQ